jgi:hypothetical protein
MGLDDIDDDIPDHLRTAPKPPASTPAGSTAASQKQKLDLDDIFGGAGRSVHASPPPAPAPQPQPARVATVAPSSTAATTGNNFLDDVFGTPTFPTGYTTMSPTGGTSSPQPQHQHHHHAQDSLIDFGKATTGKQHVKSEMELLEELMGGKKKTTQTTLGSIAAHSATSSAAQYNPHLMQLMNYYDVLGVSKTASEEEIQRVYKKKSIELHPDRQRGRVQPPEEVAVYKLMTQAHEVLIDPVKRAEYDKQLLQESLQPTWLQHV